MENNVIQVEFNKAVAFSPEVKAKLVAVLKETEELKTFITHVEGIVIKELTDGDNQPWYKEMLDIAVQIGTECPQEAIDAFSGLSNLPAEWKGASAGDWIQFAIEFLIEEGKLITSVFVKPAPALLEKAA